MRAAAKRKFDPSKSLKVKIKVDETKCCNVVVSSISIIITFYSGNVCYEFAIDQGSPLRELFWVFSLECSRTYFRGDLKYFDVHTAAVKVLIALFTFCRTVIWDRLWPCRVVLSVPVFVRGTLTELKWTLVF